MVDLTHVQSSFTAGELDERLHARVDIDQYQRGAKKLRNVIVIPQGGAQVRFGTEFVDDFTAKSAGYADNLRLATFEFGERGQVILVFNDLKVDIYLDEGVTPELKAIIDTPYSAADVKDLEFTQDENQLIVVHPNFIPQTLEPIDFPNTWPTSLTPFVFKQKPVYDFARDYDDLFFDPSDNREPGENNRLEARESKTGTPVAFFKERHLGGIAAINGGTMQIQALLSGNTIASCNIISEMSSSTTRSGKDVFIGEAVFSDPANTLDEGNRGFPSNTTFFQNRLIFGNTETLPSGVWGSVINDIENFDEFSSDLGDSTSISNYLRSDKSNAIRGLLGVRSLVAFTSGGAFSTPSLEATPLTPSTFGFTQQSSEGMKQRTNPHFLDNQVFFVDKGGKIIHNFQYNIQRGSYQSEDISILSPQLIGEPKRLATFKNPIIDNGTFLLAVNEEVGELDGTLAVFQTVASEKVAAWTLATTDGFFRDVIAIDNKVYFITERGANQIYLERLNFNCRTDSCIKQIFPGKTTVITGLEHLNGQVVTGLGDGKVLAFEPDGQPTTTVANGEVFLKEEVEFTEVGLEFIPEIIPMPIAIATQTGNDLYLPKYIKRVFVDFFESVAITLNGKVIKDLDFTFPLDSAPVPKTGFAGIATFNGWDSRQEITISQVGPFPMLIRAIGYEIEIR